MKHIVKPLAISLALAFTLAGCGQQQDGEPVTRIALDGSGTAEPAKPTSTPDPKPTPDVMEACETVQFEQIPLTHCIADPARHRITTALAPASGKPWRSLASFAAARPADALPVAFAMNAGMFDDEGKPIGYYVQNGKRLKQLNRADGPGNFHLKPNGVFFGGKGKWRILTSDDFYHTVGDRPDFGTQSGPMLVIGGKLHPQITENGPSKATRNGVGIDKQGRAHFVISNAPLSFGQLARYFRDELKTPNALFLDGNVSALWDPAAERMDGGAPIGPIIVVEQKD